MFELSGVLLFAMNVAFTFAFGQSAFAENRPIESIAADGCERVRANASFSCVFLIM
jgi:hypothetical protein